MQVGDKVELRDDYSAGYATVEIDHRDGVFVCINPSIVRRGMVKTVNACVFMQVLSRSGFARVASGTSQRELS